LTPLFDNPNDCDKLTAEVNSITDSQMEDKKMGTSLFGNGVTEEQVRAIPTPAPTSTHYPIAHGDFIDQTEMGISRAGLTVNRKEFCMANNGSQLFGVMMCDGDSESTQLALGIRHSHNKSLSGSIGCGNNVFVCDNLIFSAEVIIRRKHTRFMARDLPGMIDGMFDKLPGMVESQDEQIERFKAAKLNSLQAAFIMVSTIKRGVFPGSKLGAVLDQWEKPNHDAFLPRTAWSLLNSYTQVNKTRSAPMQFESSGLFQLFTDRLDALSL